MYNLQINLPNDLNKAIKFLPITCRENPEEQEYSSTVFLTSALERGGWLKPSPDRFNARTDLVPIV